MKKLSVVVPVYYNAQSLSLLFSALEEVERKLREREIEMELIFVDDGSGDDSLKELLVLKQRRPETRVVKLTRNFGAVQAARTGLQFVTGDCFLLLAADLQDPPSLIVEMADRWLAGAKYVVCARAGRDDPGMSKLMSSLYYVLLRLLVVPDYPAGGYDLALMDRALLPYLQNSSKNINTQLFAYWLGFRPEVIPYHRAPRLHGRSRWTFGKKLKFFVDSILGFSISPLRILSAMGLLVSLLSFLYGSWIIVAALLGRTEVQGFATIVALMSFLLGSVIAMLAVMGEYLWRIFDEVNGRPGSVIDEIY